MNAGFHGRRSIMIYRTDCAGDSGSFEIEIEKLVYGGDGLARHRGQVVFVPFTAPGDRVEVRPREKKKNYVRGDIARIAAPGSARISPPCPHFGSCGGCQWQHIGYDFQVKTKRTILEEAFRHRLPESRDLSITMKAAPQPYGYRSRARIQLRGTGGHSVTGFFRHRSHTVEDVEFCPLFMAPLNRAMAEVRAAQRSGSVAPGATEVELACAGPDKWAYSVVETQEAGRRDQEEQLLSKQAGGFTYDTLPSSFFQANEFMLDDLLGTVTGQLTGEKSALDLYSGVGFFSLPLARRYRSVVSVEADPAGYRLCARNASRSGMENIECVCADVVEWMRAVGAVAAPGFDLVLLDPPRSGAGAEVMKTLAQWAPEAIVYVSCDPQTLVRDLAELPARDYRIEAVTGLDLFPQTYHFETVVSLRRR